MDCLSDDYGLKYRGHMNESESGAPCKRWADVMANTNFATMLSSMPNVSLRFDALNETAETAENYCRNPIHSPLTGPVCVITTQEVLASGDIQDCDIPRCEEGTHDHV